MPNVTSKPAHLARLGNAALRKSVHIPGVRTLSRVHVGNSGISAFYLQIHDLTPAAATTALAATTAVPSYPAIKVLPDTTVIIPHGFSIKDGALIVASSTRDTLTLIAGNDAAIVIES
jgi:hypothetical protein